MAISKGLKLGFIGAGLLLLFGAGGYAFNKTSSILDKIKLILGPVSFGVANLQRVDVEIKNTQIINQSDFAVVIENLYTNLKYKDAQTGQWTDFAIQSNPITRLTIAASGISIIPIIKLSIPTSNSKVITDMLAGRISKKIQVVTRLQINGLNTPDIINEIDFTPAPGGTASGGSIFSRIF